MLEQLIDARTAGQNIAAQLASKSSQVQQLASDRDLALQKLCHRCGLSAVTQCLSLCATHHLGSTTRVKQQGVDDMLSLILLR